MGLIVENLHLHWRLSAWHIRRMHACLALRLGLPLGLIELLEKSVQYEDELLPHPHEYLHSTSLEDRDIFDTLPLK